MKNVNKIALVKVVKISILMDLDSKYMGTINNVNIDVAENLGLINIKNTGNLLTRLKKK